MALVHVHLSNEVHGVHTMYNTLPSFTQICNLIITHIKAFFWTHHLLSTDWLPQAHLLLFWLWGLACSFLKLVPHPRVGFHWECMQVLSLAPINQGVMESGGVSMMECRWWYICLFLFWVLHTYFGFRFWVQWARDVVFRQSPYPQFKLEHVLWPHWEAMFPEFMDINDEIQDVKNALQEVKNEYNKPGSRGNVSGFAIPRNVMQVKDLCGFILLITHLTELCGFIWKGSPTPCFLCVLIPGNSHSLQIDNDGTWAGNPRVFGISHKVLRFQWNFLT